MADYKVDVDLVNSLAQTSIGQGVGADPGGVQGGYFGHWVEKGFDEFTVYVAFVTDDLNSRSGTSSARFPAPHTVVVTTGGGKKNSTTNSVTVSERGGERFSGFVVPVGDILYSNTAPIASNGRGYAGNPRIGKCTYPTVMWSISGIPSEDAAYLYGNLNGTNPTITLKP